MPGRNMWKLTGAIAGLALAAGAAHALFQDNAAQLRASGFAGEQADGYMGLVGSPPAEVRAQVDDVNLKRRAHYTDLARERNATVKEVAATTACQLLATRVAPGQYYRLPDGVWRKRAPGETVPLPAYCPG